MIKRVLSLAPDPLASPRRINYARQTLSVSSLKKTQRLAESRTVNYKGYNFDIGGHRFFTKVKAVDEMWREVLLNGDFLRRRRLSRIYYNKKFFHYPLRLFSTLRKIGALTSFLISAELH